MRNCEGFFKKVTFASLFSIAIICQVQAQQENVTMQKVGTISLPTVKSGLNHMDIDTARHRLFVSAPSNRTLEIIDLTTQQVIKSLPGERPAAVRFIPEFNQLYVPSNQFVLIYNGTTYEKTGQIDLGSGLDEIQYDLQTKRLYVGCMTTDKTGIAVIAIPEGKLQTIIKLSTKPQAFAVEHDGNRLFANNPVTKQVSVINTVKQLIQQSFMVSGEGNCPIALNEANHRLFVGCRNPQKVLVIDTETGKEITKVDIHGDCDDMLFDTYRKRIYVACGEGFIDVIDQTDADHYRMKESISTVSGSRNFVMDKNHLYLAVPPVNNRPAEVFNYKLVPQK
jgi:DNA-binding beta-propeller fold protein YncE